MELSQFVQTCRGMIFRCINIAAFWYLAVSSHVCCVTQIRMDLNSLQRPATTRRYFGQVPSIWSTILMTKPTLVRLVRSFVSPEVFLCVYIKLEDSVSSTEFPSWSLMYRSLCTQLYIGKWHISSVQNCPHEVMKKLILSCKIWDSFSYWAPAVSLPLKTGDWPTRTNLAENCGGRPSCAHGNNDIPPSSRRPGDGKSVRPG